MNDPIKKQKANRIAAFAALAGLVFCMAGAFDLMEGFCYTEGCVFIKYVELFGISLWWWGAGAFAVLGVLIVLGKPRLAFWLGFSFVAFDALLLAWLAITAPCLTCILAGVLFVLTFFLIYRSMEHGPKAARILAAVWFFALSPNFFATVLESVDPWPIYGNARAGTYLYYSPTCPACKDAIVYLRPRLAGPKGNIACFPVAHNKKDLEKTKIMMRSLGRGRSFFEAYNEALRASVFDGQWGLADEVKLRIRLYRNKIALLRTGSHGVPVLVSRGGPRRPKTSPPTPTSPTDRPAASGEAGP